jgi:hypothetical protein
MLGLTKWHLNKLDQAEKCLLQANRDCQPEKDGIGLEHQILADLNACQKARKESVAKTKKGP